MMIKLHRRDMLQFGGAVLATAITSSGGHAQSNRKTRIAFANFDDEANFGSLVLRGMKRAAEENPEYEVLFYDNKKDGARAMEIARTIATVKPDVFIEYNSIVPQVNVQIARLLKEVGIPILSIQVRVPETPLFAVDNGLSGSVSGKAVAEAAKKRWPDEKPVALVIGLPESGAMFKERSDNAITGINEVFPGIALEQQSSKEQVSVARQVTTDFLTKNPGRKVIVWAHVDAMGLSALAAVRNSGRESDVVIGATGGDPAAFPEIRKAGSPFVGSFSFFPDNWGSDLLPLAARLARRESIPDITRPTRQLFVEASNIDQYFPK